MARIGIVGTGSTFGIAHYHAMAISQDGRAYVSAVCSSDPIKAGKWVREHGLDAVVCSSYEQLLDCVDAVVICTPNAFHCKQVLGAIETGKHFLVEKPVAITTDQCLELEKAIAGYDKVNMMGFTYRHSSAVKAARKIIAERMGKIYLFSAFLGGCRLTDSGIPLEWRMRRSMSGSGALGDFGSHAVDLASYLCGQRYDEISCMTGTFIGKRDSESGLADVENDDVALFQGRSRNGLGSFSMSRIGMVEPRFLITGEGGLLEIDLAGSGHLLYMEKKTNGPYTGKIEEIKLENPNSFDGMIADQMKAFIDAIEGSGISFIADVSQGCYVERILLAAEEASRGRFFQAL